MSSGSAAASVVGINSGEGEKEYLITKAKLKQSNGFGGKTIGFLGGFSLLVSNLTGPGLVSLSLQYQNSGYITPTLALVLMMLMSTLAAVLLCEAMATLPGNESLQGRVEFTTLVRFFFGRKGHFVAQIFINVALQATNIAGIVISTQVMDSMFVAFFHTSCGVMIHPHFQWFCQHTTQSTDSPFGDSFMLFTIGFLVVMCVIIPLGYLNLDDNIVIQVVAFVFLVGVIIDWIVTFFKTGLPNPVAASHKNQADVLGTVMFNFAYITTVPSWVNEKKPSVSIHRSLWSAAIISTITFFLVGYLGARAFLFSEDSDILSVINDSALSSVALRELAHILVYLFPLMVLATSIPVYSIIVRYNLLQNKVCNKLWANLFAVVLPWVVAIPFLSGGGLVPLMNWSSLLFASVANFIIPFILYIKACNFRLREREHLTEEQLEIIRSMHEQQEEPPLEESAAASSFKRLSTTTTPHSSQKRFSPSGGDSSSSNLTAAHPGSHHSSQKQISVQASSGSSRQLSANGSYRSLSSAANGSYRTIAAANGSYRNIAAAANGSQRHISATATGSKLLSEATGSSSKRFSAIISNSPLAASASEEGISNGAADAVPTPLPPEFIAIPFTTPESAKWIASFSVALMAVLVVGVIMLYIYSVT